MSEEVLEVVDTSLEEWLELLCHPPEGKVFVCNMFPSDGHRDEWLRTSHLRTDAEVRLLLRHFLVSTGSNLMDRLHAQHLVSRVRDGVTIDELTEHDRRLLKFVGSKGEFPVWEGLAWVMDLLPQHPRTALSVVDAFFRARWARLTDNYLTGLSDAEAVIRNRYIESPHTEDRAERALLSLNWRELEWLCGVLYEHMGFDVSVTPRGNDDGVDLFARSKKQGEKTLIVIQAKRWGKPNRVGKKDVRELLGTIDLHRATRGVLVATGRFESGAVEMTEVDPRLELLGCRPLLQMLNEHCGADWFTRVDRLLRSIRQRSE